MDQLLESNSIRKRADSVKTERMIAQEIGQIVARLRENQRIFDMTGDDDLLDALIYEQNALLARYRYLFKLARDQAVPEDDKEENICLTPSALPDF